MKDYNNIIYTITNYFGYKNIMQKDILSYIIIKIYNYSNTFNIFIPIIIIIIIFISYIVYFILYL